MKNLFAYDFTNNTIVASKTTLKKAGNPTTPEYKALMKMIAGQPTFRVVEKVIKDNGRIYNEKIEYLCSLIQASLENEMGE